MCVRGVVGEGEVTFSWVCKIWIGLGKGYVLREIKPDEKVGGGGDSPPPH